MQEINFKKSALVVAMMLATGYIGSAAAHYAPGAPLTATTPTTSLGGLNAYDVYHTTCWTATAAEKAAGGTDITTTNPTAHLRVGVAGISSEAAAFTITGSANRGAYPGTSVQASCTDKNNANSLLLANDAAYCNTSSTSNANGSVIVTPVGGTGNGAYDIVVSHPVAGTAAQSVAGQYNAMFHCEDAGNLHSKTTIDGVVGNDYIQTINY
jgi:hypothetical protein